MLYFIELYIDIITSMSYALSFCVLFILLMQSLNGAQSPWSLIASACLSSWISVFCVFFLKAFLKKNMQT